MPGRPRMISDEAFLQAILEHPDENAPRLVYADWLEECGDVDRAEFIRLQCGDGSPTRQAELLRQHGSHWAGQVAHHAYSFAFRRGFIEEIAINASAFLEIGPSLFDAAPIRLLRLIGTRAVMNRIFASPLLGRLRALHLTGCGIGDDGAELLAACRYLTDLQILRLGHNALGDRAVAALTDSPNLGNLHTLVLASNLIDHDGACLLAASTSFPHLQTLDLSNNQIGHAGTQALAHSPLLQQLQRLDLSDQHKDSSLLRGRLGRGNSIDARQKNVMLERV